MRVTTFENTISQMTPGQKIKTGLRLVGQGTCEGCVDIASAVVNTVVSRRINNLLN